ncbi:MAG: hypothetical protein SGILL_007051 [Bacillariaceae sp.]
MKFPSLSLSLAALCLASTSADTERTYSTGSVKATAPTGYSFDKDVAGTDKCIEARDKQEDPENFRLYCVNKAESFKYCAQTCSDALFFDGSTGRCRDFECDFYKYSFEGQDSEELSMREMAKGKATMFAVVPLWESQAQYFYELLEEVRKDYKQDTQALLLPMDADPTDVVTIEPFHSPRVHILNTTNPAAIGGHPFLGFVSTLRYSSGFRDFNVFTDRPVLFMISPDGKLVERLVVPTYDQITKTLEDFGVEKNQGTDEL